MAASDVPPDVPHPTAFEDVFRVYEVRVDDGAVYFYGDPLVPPEQLMERVWPQFREAGYKVELSTDLGEYVMVAEPKSLGVDGIPWTNLLLAVATVLSTLYTGALWYHADLSNPLNVLRGWPFMVGIMTVLGVHEFGHYFLSRYHEVDASLPYFIPVPFSPIGTFGAVIRMRDRMPDRRALFDIGVAGPLAGLAATVVITVVGLYLDPVTVPDRVANSENVVQIQFGFPPLLHLLSMITGQPLSYPEGKSVNPVVIAGWVGMFVTFLNLLPVGQLDGGHILRASLGRATETVATLVPGVLFGLAGYLYLFGQVSGNAVFLWVFWGFFAGLLAYAGSATPVEDASLDGRRKAIAALTFLLGILCFHPVPIRIIG